MNVSINTTHYSGGGTQKISSSTKSLLLKKSVNKYPFPISFDDGHIENYPNFLSYKKDKNTIFEIQNRLVQPKYQKQVYNPETKTLSTFQMTQEEINELSEIIIRTGNSPEKSTYWKSMTQESMNFMRDYLRVSGASQESEYAPLLETVIKPTGVQSKNTGKIFDDKNHFLDDPVNMSLLFSNAKHLMNKFRARRVVGLGQSPAWVLEAAKILDSNPDRFSNVAFSGNFYDISDKSLNTRDKNKIATEEQLTNYKHYLTTCNLTPRKIIDTPIVLVEHTHSGAGLKSFLDVLFDWAKDEGCLEALKKSIHVHILVGEDMLHSHCPMVNPDVLCIKSGQKTRGSFLVEMANSDDTLDRLDPHYPRHKWTESREELNQFGINSIRSKLNEYAKSRFQLNAR